MCIRHIAQFCFVLLFAAVKTLGAGPNIVFIIADDLGWADVGFVHRDVKPSNIMLGRNGNVKLLDLGLARFQLSDTDQADMTGTGQAMGTADWRFVTNYTANQTDSSFCG